MFMLNTFICMQSIKKLHHMKVHPLLHLHDDCRVPYDRNTLVVIVNSDQHFIYPI